MNTKPTTVRPSDSFIRRVAEAQRRPSESRKLDYQAQADVINADLVSFLQSWLHRSAIAWCWSAATDPTPIVKTADVPLLALKLPDLPQLGEPPMPEDAYYMLGYDQQIVAVVPSRDLVIVRLGLTREESAWDHARELTPIVRAFPRRY